MAQIKNIKKPGDLIRGAKVGPAALDKDGNVITLKDLAANAGKVLTVNSDGTVSFQDVPSEFPDGAQSGDVLAWGGETGPEWRPHYPESGSEGDVLTLGETGPEWTPPAGGGKLKYICLQSPEITHHGFKFSIQIGVIVPDTVSTVTDAITWLTKTYSQQYRVPCAFRSHSDASASNSFIMTDVNVLFQVGGINYVLRGYTVDFTNGSITNVYETAIVSNWTIVNSYIIE